MSAALKQKLLSQDEEDDAVELEDTRTFGQLKSNAAAATGPAAPPSLGWGWPATVFLVVFSTHISLNIILQHAIAPAEGFGSHCFALVQNGWLSDCGVAFSFHIPSCYVFIGGWLYWLVTQRPTHTAEVPRDRVHIGAALPAVGVSLSVVMIVVQLTVDILNNPPVTPLLVLEQGLRLLSWALSVVTMILCRRNYHRPCGALLVFWMTQYLALIMELGANINFMGKQGFRTSFIPFIVEFVAGSAICLTSIRFLRNPAYSSNEEVAALAAAKQASTSWPPFTQVWAMFSPDWPLLLLGCICAVGQGLFTIFSLQRFARVMSGIAVNGGSDEVRKQTILFFVYTFILCAFLAVQASAFGSSGERAIRRIRDLMYRKLLEQDRQFLDRKENSIGTLVARLTSDADAVGAVLTTQFSDAVTPAVRAISGFVLLFKISWQLSILALGVSVYNIVFVSVRSTYVTAQFSGKYSDRRAKAVAKGTEVLKGIDAVQLCGEQAREGATFRRLLDDQYHIGRLRATTEGFFQASEVFLTFTIVGVAIWYGSILILQGYMKVEELASFALVTMNATSSLGQMTRVFPQMANAAGPAGRVLLIIHRDPVKDGYIDQNRGMTPESLKGDLELRDVRFSYSESTRPEPDVNVSLKVPEGKSLALVGQSGAGKSTIMQLMMRQYDLRHGRDMGQVLVDGNDVRDLSPRWLLDHVGVVSQRPVVFNESIYFNVTYGYRRHGGQTYHWAGQDRVVSEADFWAAIKGANATDFITEDILDDPEVVGEDGDKLSGGQRQRVAIARVLLRNPRLLFLDEATSALDPEGEWQVVEALRNISTGRTCVMIAHRLNTISHADHIIVLVKGRCVESGTHTELLAKKGVYFEMYQKQQETHW